MAQPVPVTPPKTIPSLRARKRLPLRLVMMTVAFFWVPCAVLSAWQGPQSLKAFLGDFAAQSRLVVVIPLLLLAYTPLARRLRSIADHFEEAGLVDEAGRAEMERCSKALRAEGESLRVRLSLVVLSWGPVLSLVELVQSTPVLRPWVYTEGNAGELSAAGIWYLLAALPFVLFLLLRWIWRQALWARFLRSTTRLNLRLVPSHPDHAGGLSFVESCLRKYYPFCFAMGTLVAGGIANRVVYYDQPVTSFRYHALIPVALVLIICLAPLSLFFNALLKARRVGVFEYGALASAMGRRFERKWVGRDDLSEALSVQDFSATTDLNSIVGNVFDLRLVPFTYKSMIRLALWTVVPMLPVILLEVPLEVVLERVVKQLL